MSPVQIIRTVAIALIAGGAALGLVPSGSCGAGWWEPSPGGSASFGWFAHTDISSGTITTCGTAMEPVGSWATALVVIGVALLLTMWFNTHYRPKTEEESGR
ncbi:hypothetical protein [Nocardiopsis alkaliphila]|uniref:hypothetical protein n=1 Tax=Nocardiopsis alkaliphila TaxID=225762 RepID=UPI00037EACE1|nr:hypothetical protein [Nocardiopsis alkaliphila]